MSSTLGVTMQATKLEPRLKNFDFKDFLLYSYGWVTVIVS